VLTVKISFALGVHVPPSGTLRWFRSPQPPPRKGGLAGAVQLLAGPSGGAASAPPLARRLRNGDRMRLGDRQPRPAGRIAVALELPVDTTLTSTVTNLTAALTLLGQPHQHPIPSGVQPLTSCHSACPTAALATVVAAERPCKVWLACCFYCWRRWFSTPLSPFLGGLASLPARADRTRLPGTTCTPYLGNRISRVKVTSVPKWVFVASVHDILPDVGGRVSNIHRRMTFANPESVGVTLPATSCSPSGSSRAAAAAAVTNARASSDGVPPSACLGESRLHHHRGPWRGSSSAQFLLPGMPPFSNPFEREGARLRGLPTGARKMVRPSVPPRAAPNAEGEGNLSFN
jgi:hypothetical protein